MQNHIKLPYSETSGHIPSSDRLHVGEMWINGTDAIIGTKKQDGSIIQFAQFTPQERQKLLTADFIPKSGAVPSISTSALASTASGSAIVINDSSDIAIEYTATADDVINVTINKTTGHKATKVVINKPAGIHCTINWVGVDQWLATVDQPIFGESDDQQELCVAVFTSKTLNAVNVIYNTEDPEADQRYGYWGEINGDINDQQDLINLLATKANKTDLNALVPATTAVGDNVSKITNVADSSSSSFELIAQASIANRARETTSYHSMITGSSDQGIKITQRPLNSNALIIENENGDVQLSGNGKVVNVSELLTATESDSRYLGINDTAKVAKQLETPVSFSLSGAVVATAASTDGTNNVDIKVNTVNGALVTGIVPQATRAVNDQLGNEINTTYATKSELTAGLSDKVTTSALTKTLSKYALSDTVKLTYATKDELAQKQDAGDYATNDLLVSTVAKYLPLTGGTLTGNLTGVKFIGSLQGNADSATKATQDGDGNVIATTYVKIADEYAVGTITITNKITISNPPSDGTDGANKNYVDSSIASIDFTPYAKTVDVQSTYATKTDVTDQLALKADKASLNDYLQKTGGTITGSLIVPEPTAGNHAATKNYVDTAVSTVYKYKGNVDNVEALPQSDNNVGDVYNCVDSGDNYVWTGNEWDKLAGTIDLSGYLTKSSAQSTYITFTAAAGTYLSQTDAQSTYLTQNNASSTYLKTLDAQSTYLSKTEASSTYLKSAIASNTYLKKSDASSTYLSKTQASTTYATPQLVSSSISALDSRFLMLTGGTVTGPIVLANDPTEALQAATKQYVDASASKTFFGICSTDAATNLKTVAIDDFVRITGSRVTVLFTNGNTGSAATLNVNNTGDAPIWYLNQQLTSTDLVAGTAIELVFDGQHWVVIGALPNVRSYSTIESDNRYALRVNPTIVGTLSIMDE